MNKLSIIILILYIVYVFCNNDSIIIEYDINILDSNINILNYDINILDSDINILNYDINILNYDMNNKNIIYFVVFLFNTNYLIISFFIIYIYVK